ncbi:hypothetical protein QPL79_02695 [Ignisphaera sp. 4213-co]|uniref:ArsR family transcriptional regulator n=1 Tax=Ignisphaera cupida TaxID=3050454 RepID=A0ABD4Z5J1_9CREN|nr:hypothetical protein [Ignisphaera sp. 4213-co]MDK6028272.1 hypothetical protein [Ignisphaera sp. 4213-co]
MELFQRITITIPEDVKKKIDVFGKPCIWNIIALLSSIDSKTINITSLVSKLNSNYNHIMKCIELMKSFDMVREIRMGRVRLIKLNDKNEYVAMIMNMLFK